MSGLGTAQDARMSCMEVWGGNSAVDRAFTTAGLQIQLDSRPFGNGSGGGDVYYVSSCASGRITRLLLADVCGHGETVKAVSLALRDLMRKNINLIDQSRFVYQMNEEFARVAKEDEFATAVVCTFFSPTRSLQICNAGHPPPSVYIASEQRWLPTTELNSKHGSQAGNIPLGIAEDVSFSQYRIKLETGDMVLCVTDAFPEANDAGGRVLGSKGFLGSLQGIDATEPSQVIHNLRAEIGGLATDNLALDDATAILFRCDGSSPSWISDLLSPLRLLRNLRFIRS